MQHVIQSFVDRLQQEYPDTLAIVLKGSHALGNANPWSDIDVDVLVSTPDVEEYRTWIEPVGDRLVHISVAVESLDAWLADANEPASWSLGFPSVETTRLLWAATDELAQQLDRPYRPHPAHGIEIEDTVEALGKMRNAVRKADTYGVYRNANKLAKLIPTMLIPFNPEWRVANSREAIDAVLSLPNVPDGFREDWLICMGYVDTRTQKSTLEAASRMVMGALEMLPHDPEIVGEDFARLLSEGTLVAYLNQQHS